MTAASVGDAPRAVQATFDELGRPLHEITFCVVDLETTGGSAADGAMITEIGAVKVRGGEVLGEFQTPVNPKAPVAPFDVGFLRHFATEGDYRWPRFEVLDTVRLARHVVTRDETPNCKLSSLARLFQSSTRPNHRALEDARATVDVLHGLIGRLGNLGVHTLEELQTFTSRVHPEQRRKRHLADSLPHLPGVYLFRDERGRVLYVGKSKDLRARVRNYFTASETRS